MCVDDFGVKYFLKDKAGQFLNAIKKHYAGFIDWEGKYYLGLTIDWDHRSGHIDISMPYNIPKFLKCLRHSNPNKPKYAPHRRTKPEYGKHLQMSPVPYSSTTIGKKDTKFIQSAVRKLLHYANSIDLTVLCAINKRSWRKP